MYPSRPSFELHTYYVKTLKIIRIQCMKYIQYPCQSQFRFTREKQKKNRDGKPGCRVYAVNGKEW